MTTDEIIEKAKADYAAQIAARTPEEVELYAAYDAAQAALVNHSSVKNATSKTLAARKSEEFEEALKKFHIK